MFIIPKSFWKVQRGTHKKLNHDTYRGRGVFATRDIPAGMVIGDYSGIMVRPDDEDEEKHGLYYMWYNDKVTILANPKKDGIHLINHSCAPNCWMYPYKGHTLYIATRKIFKGEELTVSYLLGTPEDEEIPCQHTCKCATPLCTGTMHNSDEASERWGDFEAKHHQERYNKKLPAPFGEMLPILDSYPESRPVDLSFPVFGSLLAPALTCKERTLPLIPILRKRIIENGRQLYFKNLKLNVYGIIDKAILSSARPFRK